ncbi:MAG: purine-nucleoside phosphorylase [Oscillospiraceae bacterium]|nr:purine-nucleoside phosphorylase [Oscillospiraceae bacterium]
MAEFKGTPHNHAKLGDIAKTVLMPGDPLRAKYVAETFLEDPKCFNTVRGMLGYTGKYKGKEISIMAHGMGIPSIGIYSYELYKFYDVENIIRFGTAGAFKPEMDLFDILLVEHAYSKSTYAKAAYGYEGDVMDPSPELNEVLAATAEELGKKYWKGYVHSSDNFYSDFTIEREPVPYDLLAAEMEAFALFANARHLGKKAACILTISDSIVNHLETTPEQRQTGFTEMMEVALNAAIKL